MSEAGAVIGTGEPETPDRDGAFPRLDDDQRARLRQLGRQRTVEPGEVLFAEGDQGSDFFIVESGSVTIVQGYGKENRIIAIQGAHRFLGELSMLTGQRLYLSGVMRERGEVIQVPIEKLRELVDEDKTLSDLILGAFIARRSILIGVGTGIKLIGSRFSPDSRRLREFLARNRMPYQWIDLEEDEHAEALLGELAVDPDETPVVIASGGEILRNPANEEVATSDRSRRQGPAAGALRRPRDRRGARRDSPRPSTRPPRGSTRRGSRPSPPAARPGTSARIENYLGFPAGVSGSELTQRAGVQAIKFGVRLTAPAQRRCG